MKDHNHTFSTTGSDSVWPMIPAIQPEVSNAFFGLILILPLDTRKLGHKPFVSTVRNAVGRVEMYSSR